MAPHFNFQNNFDNEMFSSPLQSFNTSHIPPVYPTIDLNSSQIPINIDLLNTIPHGNPNIDLCSSELSGPHENQTADLCSSKIPKPPENPIDMNLLNTRSVLYDDNTSTKNYLESFCENLEIHNEESLTVSSNNTSSNNQYQFDSNLHFGLNKCAFNLTYEINCRTVLRTELSNLMFLSMELYDKEFTIHIQRFNYNSNKTEIYPTNEEISMDLLTWYDFSKKILKFDPTYITSSFVANNNILALNSDTKITFRNLSFTSQIKLKESQLQILKECIPEFNKSLIKFLYLQYLPKLMIQEDKVHNVIDTSSISEKCMMTNLIIWIEHEFLSIFRRIFKCAACKFRNVNPLNHPCMNFTNREKFEKLGFEILMLGNIHSIVKNMSDNIDFVTYNFLCELNIDIIQNVLFKLN